MPSRERPAAGSLADHPFACLLASLRREGFTGVLQVSSAPPHDGESRAADPSADPDGQDETAPSREIHFASGHIAWAISTDRDESLKAFLVRHGTITHQQWDEAEDRARQETLRQALTSMGVIAPRELTRLEISRVEEIISRLFSVTMGTFRVRERQLPPGTPDLEIDASALLINGVMETADRSFLEAETGSMDAVFSLAGPSPDDELLERLTVRGEFQAILKHVNGVKSVGEICSLTSLPDHFVRCVFAALSLLGCVQRDGETAASATTVRATQAPPIPETPALLPMKSVEPEMTMASSPAVEEIEAPVVPINRIEREPAAPVLVMMGADRPADDESPSAAERFAFDERDRQELESRESTSIYESQARETSRGWFMVGAAMAVGLAAVFLLLFARDGSDRIELGRLSTEDELAQEDSDAVPPGAMVSGPAVRSHSATSPVTAPAREPVPPAYQPPAAQPAGSPPPLAPTRRTPILPVESPSADTAARSAVSQQSPTPASATTARTATGSLASRDRLEHLEQRSGRWSIQILLACEEATVDRAIRQGGQSDELFVLPVTHEGRACHRVYWGRYPDRADAEYALQHDVPPAYRSGGARPWITRLPS